MRFKADFRPKYLAGLFPIWLWYSLWWVMRVCLVIVLLFCVIFATILFLRVRHAALAHPQQRHHQR